MKSLVESTPAITRNNPRSWQVAQIEKYLESCMGFQ